MTTMKQVLEKFLDGFPSTPLYHDDDYKIKAALFCVAIYLGYGFLLGVYRSTCVHTSIAQNINSS